MTPLSRTTRITIVPKGFSDRATDLEIEDEAAGEYLVIKQNPDNKDPQRIAFDKSEWPAIVQAAETLFKEMENNK